MLLVPFPEVGIAGILHDHGVRRCDDRSRRVSGQFANILEIVAVEAVAADVFGGSELFNIWAGRQLVSEVCLCLCLCHGLPWLLDEREEKVDKFRTGSIGLRGSYTSGCRSSERTRSTRLGKPISNIQKG